MKRLRTDRTGSAAGRRQRKSEVRRLLESGELEQVTARAREEGWVGRALYALALDPDELIAWRAIDAIGCWAALRAQDDLEYVREMLRRQIWSITDESGNVPWKATWIIGSILHHVPALVEEYARMIGQYIHETPFEAGADFALAQCAAHDAHSIVESLEMLREELGNKEPLRRAHAANALGHAGDRNAYSILHTLGGDDTRIEDYNFSERRLDRTSVGEIARRALARIDAT